MDVNMIQEIPRYHKLVFPTTEAAQAASAALMNFITSNVAAVMTMVGPERVVMWEQGEGLRMKTLYVSPGALNILRRLVPVPADEIVARWIFQRNAR